jgi:hypothetical protein
VIEVRRTWTLRLLLAAVLLAMPVTLAAAPGAQQLVRIGLAVLAVTLGWSPALGVTLGLGERALRPIEWTRRRVLAPVGCRGTGLSGRAAGIEYQPGRLASPFWKGPSGRRFQALLEAAATGAAFRALKGRLNC